MALLGIADRISSVAMGPWTRGGGGGGGGGGRQQQPPTIEQAQQVGYQRGRARMRGVPVGKPKWLLTDGR